MLENRRWVLFLVWRVIIHSLVGVVLCGVVGMLLIAASGALTGWVVSNSYTDLLEIGAIYGGVLGGLGGALTGFIAFGIRGFCGPSRRSYWPARAVVSKVVLSMTAATVGVMASYFVLCAISAFSSRTSLSFAVNDTLLFILFGAPAIIVCGQIVGAIWAFRGAR